MKKALWLFLAYGFGMLAIAAYEKFVLHSTIEGAWHGFIGLFTLVMVYILYNEARHVLG